MSTITEARRPLQAVEKYINNRCIYATTMTEARRPAPSSPRHPERGRTAQYHEVQCDILCCDRKPNNIVIIQYDIIYIYYMHIYTIVYIYIYI